MIEGTLNADRVALLLSFTFTLTFVNMVLLLFLAYTHWRR